MYTEFFGLNEKPFAITPDPRYLYMSARHADALAAPGLRHLGKRRVHPADRRGRHGQDHADPQPARAAAREGRDRADLESAAVDARVLAGDLSGAAHGHAARGLRQSTYRRIEHAFAARLRRGSTRRPDRRRSANAEPRAARAGTVAHEPRDAQEEAAADHSDRAARAARRARAARDAAARAADHRSLSPRAAQQKRHCRLRASSNARGRRPE